MINYITNLNVDEHSGGWSGMNHNVYNQLKEHDEVTLVQEINPRYNLSHKIISKSARMLGFRGNFPAFTEERLDRIATLVDSKLNLNGDLNFFHGATPWLNVKSTKKYAVYLDACFATYIEVYHDLRKFNRNQLRGLYEKEAVFLNNACAVFFSSDWALNETKRKYNIDGSNFHCAGLGGGLQCCALENAFPENYFLFVGLDFEGKGGRDVVNAFNEVSTEFKNFKLKIVGGKPPADLLDGNNNIEYLGFVDKTTQEGSRRLYELFAGAYCFVLPTTKDLTPMVLVEAGSVGCPVVSTKSFGIPEIVKNQETGILLDTGNDLTPQITIAMRQFCADRSIRNKMGENAKKYIRENFNWTRTGALIREILASEIE